MRSYGDTLLPAPSADERVDDVDYRRPFGNTGLARGRHQRGAMSRNGGCPVHGGGKDPKVHEGFNHLEQRPSVGGSWAAVQKGGIADRRCNGIAAPAERLASLFFYRIGCGGHRTRRNCSTHKDSRVVSVSPRYVRERSLRKFGYSPTASQTPQAGSFSDFLPRRNFQDRHGEDVWLGWNLRNGILTRRTVRSRKLRGWLV